MSKYLVICYEMPVVAMGKIGCTYEIQQFTKFISLKNDDVRLEMQHFVDSMRSSMAIPVITDVYFSKDKMGNW